MLLGLQLVLITLGSMKQEVFDRCSTAVKEGVTSDGGEIVWLYKVAGERRIIGVLDGGLEGAFKQLGDDCSEVTDIEAKPLRTYESFARDVLGIKGNLTNPSPRFLFPGLPLFWMQLNIVHPGINTMHMLDSARRDAEQFFVGRQKMLMTADIFMVLGKYEMHAFISAPSEPLDTSSWFKPTSLDMGGYLHTKIKSIIPFADKEE